MPAPKRVLFICGGNTCRSPMAKAILSHMLTHSQIKEPVIVESAAYGAPTAPGASRGAKLAIMRILGQDALANHHAKRVTAGLLDSADVILVMTHGMKKALPPLKTWTLKEYVGETGDIPDPWGKTTETYVECAEEIRRCLELALPKIIRQLNLK